MIQSAGEQVGDGDQVTGGALALGHGLCGLDDRVGCSDATIGGPPPRRVAKSDDHCDGMKGLSRIPKTLIDAPAALVETASLIRTGMRADFIRARGVNSQPHHDAG